MSGPAGYTPYVCRSCGAELWSGGRRATEPVLVHLPHASREISPDVRAGILLDDADLERELDVMTDSFTDRLLDAAMAWAGDRVRDAFTVVAAPASRLVVDVERFTDEREPMNEVGMGAVYTRTHDGRPLRDQPDAALVDRYLTPHAAEMSEIVSDMLRAARTALIIDLHSYPSVRQPYELANKEDHRPEICLGVDEFHTPPDLVERARQAFEGFDVAINTPFAGTYVPVDRYRTDERVRSIMIEIRRDTYMDESAVRLHEGADRVMAALGRLLRLS
ncbi:MAG: N-formylglutamate amidohydrolase [Actinomycetales bacterium]